MVDDLEAAVNPARESGDDSAGGTTQSASGEGAGAVVVRRRRAWVTQVCILISIVLYVMLAMQPRPLTWESLSNIGYRSGAEIWAGAYGALLTNAFIHDEFLYLGVMAWMWWVVGTRVEYALGSMRFLGFVIVSAVIASSIQLAVSDMTGIGTGAIFYAMVGFMWMARKRYPSAGLIVDPLFYTIAFLLMLCFLFLTFFGIEQYANSGAIYSLLFGVLLGGGIGKVDRDRLRTRLSKVMATVMVGIAIVPLFYCPWSVSWLGVKAYHAHEGGQLRTAVDYYSRLIKRDPENLWAYESRSMAYYSLGEIEKSKEDDEKARAIESRLDESP